jgi:hypothetical protein
MKHIVIALTLFFFVVAAKAADHVVHLQINSYGDNIGWSFSRYNGRHTYEVIIAKNPLGIHIRKSDYTKIEAEDDSTHRMKHDERYDKEFTVRGPGIFILNFSDWNRTARVKVALNIDGKDWFRGSISSANVHDWSTEFGKWSAYVRQTGEREIAFSLD